MTKKNEMNKYKDRGISIYIHARDVSLHQQTTKKTSQRTTWNLIKFMQ